MRLNIIEINYFKMAKGAIAPYGYFMKFTFLVIALLLYGRPPSSLRSGRECQSRIK